MFWYLSHWKKMSTYTCISCHIAFNDPEIQRGHYKSDWHRYNLKRKVVGMPPVSASVFQNKVKEHQVDTNKSENDGISGFYCKLCQKRFSSHNAYENHKKSRKHRDQEEKHLEMIKNRIIAQDTNSENPDTTSGDEAMLVKKAVDDAKADIEQPKILRAEEKKNDSKEFASGDNPRMRWFMKQERALDEEKEEDEDMWEDVDDEEDMEDEDTPEDSQEGCAKDEDADLESLSSDMSVGNVCKQRQIIITECLFCLKRSKNVEKNVMHMSQQHGFFLPDIEYLSDLEGLLLYLGEKVGMGNICLWCNEKGKAFYSISSVTKHMRDKGHCNMLVTGDAALEYADYYRFDESDFELEVGEEEGDGEDKELAGLEGEELELVLPSGASIGHRSLMKYYKQNFPTVQREYHTTKQKALARLISQYKAIGWHGASVSQISKAQKDLAYVQSMKAKYRLKLCKNNNKTQMTHFRKQVVF